MAGMLAGVECARRRKLHQGGSGPARSATDGILLNAEKRGTRRSSFCLYASSSYQVSTHQHTRFQSILQQGDKLAETAREAKARLDERLKTRGCPASNMSRVEDEEIESRLLVGPLHEQVFGPKKRGGTNESIWSKLKWVCPRRDERCAMCLEPIRVGDLLVHLPCTHYFHSHCIIPWLKTQSICPCCRKQILLFEKPRFWGL